METEIVATFDQDSKRYHRFLIDPGEGVTGAIYVLKGKQIPERVVVLLKTAGERLIKHKRYDTGHCES